MSLRLVFTIIVCSIAFAHNVNGLQEQKAGSPLSEDPISRLLHSAVHPDQQKLVHRRQSPEVITDDAACETSVLSLDEVTDIIHDTGLPHSNKRSLDVAEPGCCG